MTALCHPLNVNRVFSHCSVDAAVSCSTSQAGPYTSEQCRVPLGANCTGWLVCCCMQRLSVRPLSWESHLPPSQWCEPSLSLHSALSLCGAVVVSGPRSRHRVCSSITGSFRVRVTVKMESPPSAFLAANRRSDSFHICTECGGGLAYSCDCPSLKIFSMKHFNWWATFIKLKKTHWRSTPTIITFYMVTYSICIITSNQKTLRFA